MSLHASFGNWLLEIGSSPLSPLSPLSLLSPSPILPPMPQLTKAQVEHIAKLARLKLKPEELEKMTSNLGSILQYVDMLNEVDTSSVKPTEQVTGLANILREDVVDQSKANPDDLLHNSPLPIVEHQIHAPHAHG